MSKPRKEIDHAQVEALAPGKWVPERFSIATPTGPGSVSGLSYRGLGMHTQGRQTVLTHVNTGLRVRAIIATLELTVEAATELAELTDWDFLGEHGWKNRDPDIPDKLEAWHQKHKLIAVKQSQGMDAEQRDRVTQAIARDRS